MSLWGVLKPDASGLVCAVVQHVVTGEVLMVGYMNENALMHTLATKRVTFWSRSRQCLWEKGEQSGHTLELASLHVDCDGDALLARAHPRGPTCHTGATTCFFRTVRDALVTEGEPPMLAGSVLHALEQTIAARKAGLGTTNAEGRSYVRSLLEAGPEHLRDKLLEESGELVAAVQNESEDRVASEAADVLFHVLVTLAARGVGLQQVASALEARAGVSGVDEKARRGKTL